VADASSRLKRQLMTTRGLTLIEALLALAAMALMAMISSRAIDGMLRSQRQSQQAAQDLASLQIGLAQWTRDLDHLSRTPYLSAVHWNGRVLRLVRRSASEEALQVVAWSADGQVWQRWQSAALRDRSALMQAWQDAGAAQTRAAPAARTAAATQSAEPSQGASAVLLEMAQWSLQYWEAGRWIAAQVLPDEGANAAAGRIVETPSAIRLQLRWSQGPPQSLVLDWLERSRP
jgi:general secretion pathway protein J